MPASAGRYGKRRHLLVFGLYAALALIVTYPMPLQLTRSIAANEFGAVDGFLGIWNIWWTARALTDLRDPFVTPLLFHPQGLDLFWQTLSLPQGLLALPATLALGPLPAYNLLILAGFALGGYTAFLFVRRYVPSDAAALVGGAVYALAPFHMQKVVDAQLEVASVQWVPLYLLALHALLDRPRAWLALVSGLLLLWVGLGTWYYGLFCIIYTGMAAALWSISDAKGQTLTAKQSAASAADRNEPLSFVVYRLSFNPRTFLWGCAPVLVWLAVMAPRLYSLMQTGDTLLGDAREFNERSSADLVAFFLPSPLHPLWGGAASDFYLRIHPGAFLWNASIGLVGVGLALLGARGWRREDCESGREDAIPSSPAPQAPSPKPQASAVWRWWLLLGATMLLAMGEELQAFGVNTGVPLPYALLADLPGIRSSHRPNHFVILSIALVALLAARGFHALRLRFGQGRRAAPLAAAAIALIVAVDGWAGPLPLVTREIPAGYAQLPPGGAILPVPLNLNVSRSEHLWYQTAHGRPIVGGFIGREPPYPLGRYAPGVRELRYGRRESPDILWPAWPESARESLAAAGISHVLYHPELMKDSLGPMRELIAEMGLAPTYSDAQLEVYPVPPAAAPRPLVFLGRGWGGVERDGERLWRWMQGEAEIYLVNPDAAPRAVYLELAMESFERERPLTLRLEGGPAATIGVSRVAMRRTVGLLLPPGTHVVYLGAPADPRPGRGAEQISISFERIAVR